MNFESITIVRAGGTVSYQVTVWGDGVIRWDGIIGPRVGAWQTTVSRPWMDALNPLVAALAPSNKRKGDAEGSLVVETTKTRNLYALGPDADPAEAWRLGMVVDGMCAQLPWLPLDASGQDDFSRFAAGQWMTFQEGPARGQALAFGDEVLLLAGSTANTSSAPTLNAGYEARRQGLLGDGGLALQGDLLVLTRHLLFDSPSAPASLLTGHNTNGRQTWRDATGATWAANRLS